MPTTTHSPHRAPAHAEPHPPADLLKKHAPHGVGHVVPPRILINSALGLLALTVITVAVAWIDLGEFNIYIALSIAVIKGSIVCLFFMHLRWDRPFNSIIFVSSLALVALFISFALTDSSEYQHEIIPGEAPKVKLKIDALVPPAPEPAAPAAATPAAVPH